MILYDLVCQREHRFESWFRNSNVVEKLIKAGEVACPSCGSTKVQKAPMAPRIARSDEKSQAVAAEQRELEAAMEKATNALKELREVIEKNFDHVGDKFPEEARRIHYGEAKERGIYGNASKEEAKKLLEEGIEVYAIPGKRRTNA
ncbi:MAG: DUF1178 family protein [Rhodospirillaceae bacterium]